MKSKGRGCCFSHSPHIWWTFAYFLFDSVFNYCVEDGFTIIKKDLVTINIFSTFPNILPALKINKQVSVSLTFFRYEFKKPSSESLRILFVIKPCSHLCEKSISSGISCMSQELSHVSIWVFSFRN